ncbi:MAG: hypothetical protein KL787_03970 [Taibaiella sp.]|nr:hypothetical protein [Taibaiella sp.]
MCISSHAKYDSVMQHLAVFTVQEQQGYLVYQDKCASCHREPLFLTDMSFRNNGIGIGFNGDEGRYEVTLNEADKYRFQSAQPAQP